MFIADTLTYIRGHCRVKANHTHTHIHIAHMNSRLIR